MATYPYNITDFPNGAVNAGALHQEIAADAGILIAVDKVSPSEDGLTVDVIMKDDLPVGQQTTLDGIVAAHDGTPTDPGAVPVELMKAPIVIPFPGRESWRTWFTGAGDDPNASLPASGRGTGPALYLSLNGEDEGSVEACFIEPAQLHTGEINYDSSWKMTDYAEFSIVTPANVPTELSSESSSSSGDPEEEEPVEVLKVNVGGPYHLIVPYSGGGHEMLLSEAAPVLDDDGEWWTDPETGAVSAWAGTGDPAFRCRLYDFEISGHFLRRVWLGATSGHFQPPQVYKSEWLHPKQKIKLYAKKVSTGAGKLSAWLMCYRAKST